MQDSKANFLKDYQHNSNIVRDSAGFSNSRSLAPYWVPYAQHDQSDAKKQKISKIQSRQLSIINEVVKQANVKAIVRTFIKKLRRNKMSRQELKQIQKDSSDMKRSAERFDQMEDTQYKKGYKGFEVQSQLSLTLIILTFVSIFYMHLISSFQFLLSDFRLHETHKQWVTISLWTCLGIMLLKIGSSFLTQKNVYGYRVVKLHQIVVQYGLSIQFLLDALFLASIILFLNHIASSFTGCFGYLVTLARMTITFRIDELISDYLVLGRSRRQYMALVRLLFMNLFVAHLLGTFLLWAAGLQPDHSWMHRYGIQNAHWQRQYLYSVYWAVTIITTVGFGDIAISDDAQALVVIFVMIFGCLILSYNISEVSFMLKNLQERKQQLMTDLNILQRVARNTQISNQLHRSIADYMVYAAEVKFQEEINDSKALADKLPQMLRVKYMEQSSNFFFAKVPLFCLLRRRTKLRLTQALKYEMMSPEQHLTHRSYGLDRIYILKMGTLGMGYYKEGASINGLILDQVTVKHISMNHPVLLNSFLLNKSRRLNFWLICQSFCNVTSLKIEIFIKILQQNEADYEFFRAYYDSEQALEEEWAYKKCEQCNQNHSLFNCPKMLYMPYRSLVYFREAFRRQDLGLSSTKPKTNLENIPKVYLNFVLQRKKQKVRASSLTYWSTTFMSLHYNLNSFSSTHRSKGVNMKKRDKRQYSKWQNNILNMHSRQMGVDLPHNYNYYRRRMNPERLVEKSIHRPRQSVHKIKLGQI